MPEGPRNILESFFDSAYKIIEGPAVFIRENIVTPNQKSYPWYHQKFRRVPTIDQCYTDDAVCYQEAEWQYRRDRQVDTEILTILRQRYEDCVMYESPDHIAKCKAVLAEYDEATANWFTKYGDLGGYHNVKAAYMKQKHRLIWERRYGEVGSGMNAVIVEDESKDNAHGHTSDRSTC